MDYSTLCDLWNKEEENKNDKKYVSIKIKPNSFEEDKNLL